MTDDPNTYGTHIYFGTAPKAAPDAKTLRWYVHSKYGDRAILADIAWFPSWRKYAVYPRPGTIFEEVCLREIADFVEGRTKAHREKRKETPC